MKKTTAIALSICLMALWSCNKNTPPANGGTWTLNGLKYQATQAFFITNGITAYTGTNVPTGTLSLSFYDSTSNTTLDSLTAQYNRALHAQGIFNRDTVFAKPSAYTWPPKLNSYKLTTSVTLLDSGYVFMQLTDSSVYNSYQITGSTTPNVTVTRSNSGLVTISVPPVEVWNINGTPVYDPQIIGKPTHTDSCLVSGTVIQTQ